MSNVDPQELAKFSELAHRWWDPESEFRPLHQINPLRLDWIDSAGRPARQAVLDVGCGGGILAEAMARRGAARDRHRPGRPSRWAWRGCTRWKPASTNIEYREVAAEALAAERPAAFDVVTCMEMLEHVPDPASVVQACATLVKPGRLGVLLHAQPQPQVASCSPSSAPSTCCKLLPTRHARVRALHPAQRTGALVPRRRPGRCRPAAAWNTTR